VSHRLAVRGRWYWFRLGRSGFIEFGQRRLVWHLFTVPHVPPRVKDQP